MAVAETYICACEGYTEYGWTIKEAHDYDDSLYDIIIGTIPYDTSSQEAKKKMNAEWEKTRRAAEAFAREANA